jgi:hypothetical protein
MTCQAPYLLVKVTINVDMMMKDLGRSLEIYIFIYIHCMSVIWVTVGLRAILVGGKW